MKGTILAFVLLAIPQLLSAPLKESIQDITDLEFATNLTVAKETAKNEPKPVMVIIQSSTCPASAQFLSKLMESNDMKLASKNFVLVNSIDRQDPECLTYVTDHTYIPRVLFFGSNGDILPVTNSKKKKYKYYYKTVEDVINSMNNPLELHRKPKCEH